VDSVIVNGEIVVRDGHLSKVDEMEVLRLAERSRRRLEPSIQRELAAARTAAPRLTEMYFRVFEKPFT
jgi:Ethanolamine utilization protein EutJ (predicted chaperonin)